MDGRKEFSLDDVFEAVSKWVSGTGEPDFPAEYLQELLDSRAKCLVVQSLVWYTCSQLLLDLVSSYCKVEEELKKRQERIAWSDMSLNEVIAYRKDLLNTIRGIADLSARLALLGDSDSLRSVLGSLRSMERSGSRAGQPGRSWKQPAQTTTNTVDGENPPAPHLRIG